MACELKYPECILFVDKLAYDYKRWHVLGICAYYVEKYEEGRKACLIAIENGRKQNINVDIDISNLKFYEEKQSGSSAFVVEEEFTKKQYIENKIKEFSESDIGLTEKQKQSKALSCWKNRKNKM